MINILKKIYRKHSDSILFKIIGDLYRNGGPISNYLAYRRVRKISKFKGEKNRKIRVVFLCQYGQVWNKLKTVYEKLINDNRFEVLVVAISENISSPDKNIYEYFKKECEKFVIDAYDKNEWYDLELFNPDYVFYQRPYDQYLPKPYRSGEVSKYAKILYLNYGFMLAKPFRKICLSKTFCRNVYCFFAENLYLQNFNISRFKYSHKKGYKKTLNIGYPALENFLLKKKCEKKDLTKYKILWTPRWIEDKHLGGSNFMKYKDRIFEIADMNEKFNLIFRPHPMTFSHMVEIGKMTQKDVKEYINKIVQNNQMKYDVSIDYTNVFWDTDIMITDISSIIMEYYVTGKPIIYCKTGAIVDEFFKKVLDTLYVVDSWDEVKKMLEYIYDGNDPKKEERTNLINNLLGGDLTHISDRFVEEIYNDYISK